MMMTIRENEKYISHKPYVQYAIVSNYLGCYRVIIVYGYDDVRKTVKNNQLIEGELVEFEGKVILNNLQNVLVKTADLNKKEGLDPIQCFEDRVSAIHQKLKESDRNPEYVMAIYKFIDDMHYSCQYYSGYFKLKKVTREYHY